MSAFYDRARATASRLLQSYGSLVSLRRRDPAAAYDPATGSVTSDPGTIYSGYAVVADYPAKMIDGSSVLAGDKRVTLQASSTMVDPVPGDFVAIGALEYRVVGVSNMAPAGTTIIYTLQVRR